MTKEDFLAKHQHKWLTVDWTTGGMSGGNCWGDSPSYSVESEEEPDLEVLDEILMEESPTLTYMEYRMMIKDPNLIIRRTWTDSEYYGNHYNKASKQLDLEVLWSYMELIIAVPDPNVRLTHYKLTEK